MPPPPGDGIERSIERFSVPEQPAGNAQQRRDYNSVKLVSVSDSRLNTKPPQEGRVTSTTTSTSSTTKASNAKNLKILFYFQCFLNIHLKTLKFFFRFTMLCDLVKGEHCKTIEILEILEV